MGAYVNFLEDEGPERVRAAYPGATWDRLREIKRRYDPTNLFRRTRTSRRRERSGPGASEPRPSMSGREREPTITSFPSGSRSRAIRSPQAGPRALRRSRDAGVAEASKARSQSST